jgi:hypothetical protein
MADYYNFHRVTQMFGVTEATLVELQVKGFLDPTVKGGRLFLSSHQVYRLRVALHKAQEDKITLLQAFEQLEERWEARTVEVQN